MSLVAKRSTKGKLGPTVFSIRQLNKADCILGPPVYAIFGFVEPFGFISIQEHSVWRVELKAV